MDKVYYLKTCSTCQRIIKDVDPDGSIPTQNIKEDKITPAQLEEMKNLSGSYESLFSRKAMKFRAQGLHEKTLSENDYKSLILEEYTFLKRPVFIIQDQIFVGNSKKVVEEVAQAIAK